MTKEIPNDIFEKWEAIKNGEIEPREIELSNNLIIQKKAKEFRQRKKLEDPKNEFNKVLEDMGKDRHLKEVSNMVKDLLIDKKPHKATEIVVNYIMDNEHIYTTRDDDKSEVWIYKEGIYIPQGKTYIEEIVRKILGRVFTTTFTNRVIYKIQVDTYIDQDKFFNEKEKNLIPVKNGLLNIKTKELLPFDPKNIFFNKFPIIYNPAMECPNINIFFKEVLINEDEIKVMQEIFGFLLYNEYFLEKAFMFNGFGRNGKGKTIGLMKKFIGIDNCSEIPLEDLEKDIFSIGELFKKRANLCGDLSRTALKNTGIFKKLTGRDLISAARKFKTRVTFENYAKMIFACNELPITYDLTEAFFNRWIIIDFPYTFLTQQEINKIENKTNVKLQDPEILEKISNEEEMSGLLNWALEGLDRLFLNKSFSFSPTTVETKRKWLRRSDSCYAFIMDYIEIDFQSSVSKEEFRLFYSKYCIENKLKPSSDKVIKSILNSNFGITEVRKLINGEIKNLWWGMKFNSNCQGCQGCYGFPTYIENNDFSPRTKNSLKPDNPSKSNNNIDYYTNILDVSEEKVQ